MSDPTALCARLRAVEGDTTQYYRNPEGPETASLIESQAREIEELRNKHKDHLFALLNAHNTRVATLESRIAALEEALRPFAKKADEFEDEEPDEAPGYDGAGELFTVGDFRKARAALAKEAK